MTHVFVHGVPESEAVWWPLAAELRSRGIDDVVLLSPPGFGSPVPDGWDATQTSYRDWLIGELESIGGRIHLVGHDWGAGHVLGVLAHRPDLLTSWATDCAGLLHPEYTWHDMAQAWQTPEVGEQVVAAMAGAPAGARGGFLTASNAPAEVVAHVAAALDETMGRSILSLYRSAVQPALRDLGDRAAAGPRVPGLVVIATEDHYTGTTEMAAQSAARVGAATVVFDGASHWWMLERPAAAADALTAFWSGVSAA